MTTPTPAETFKLVKVDHTLATAAKVSAAVAMLHEGRITEAQAQRRINSAYRDASAASVDPYRERIGRDPHQGLASFLRVPASATVPDVDDVLDPAGGLT